MCPVDKNLLYITKKYNAMPYKILMASKNITIYAYSYGGIKFIFHHFRIGNEKFRISFKLYGNYLAISEIKDITNGLFYGETAFFIKYNKSLIFNKINRYLNIFIKNKLNWQVKKWIYKKFI